MDVFEYRPAAYPEFGGLLNRMDVPADRFFMNWDLRRAVRQAVLRPDDLLASGAGLVEAGDKTIRGRSGPVELEEIQSTKPDGGREVVLVRIPRDFYAMLRETDVEDPEVRRIPVEWRTRTRTVFQDLLAGGYRVVDFGLAGRPRPSPFYILRRNR
jgi:predicted GNAT superfamily acetyltransferase